MILRIACLASLFGQLAWGLVCGIDVRYWPGGSEARRGGEAARSWLRLKSPFGLPVAVLSKKACWLSELGFPRRGWIIGCLSRAEHGCPITKKHPDYANTA